MRRTLTNEVLLLGSGYAAPAVGSGGDSVSAGEASKEREKELRERQPMWPRRKLAEIDPSRRQCGREAPGPT
jgi:hypothetical protein